jgi:urease accessory protein
MLTFTQRLDPPLPTVDLTLALTAEERTRSRYRFDLDEQPLLLRLPRGTLLHNGDGLRATTGEVLQIIAKPEPVFTVTAEDTLTLLQTAYHLGNRHVSLEIAPTYLRLTPDPVLKAMLHQLGVMVTEEVVPFEPESGAYHRH